MPPGRSARRMAGARAISGRGRMLATTRSNDCWPAQQRMREARSRHHAHARGDAVEAHVVFGDAGGDRIVVAGDDASTRQCACRGDGQDGGAAAEVEHAREAATSGQSVDRLETAGRGGVVAGAEGFAGFDLDGRRSQADAGAIVAAVHDEAAGEDRRQRGLRDGNPVGVGHRLDRGAADARAEMGERAIDVGRRRFVLVVGFDDESRWLVLEQRHRQRLRLDHLAQQSRHGSSGIEIGGTYAELEQQPRPSNAKPRGWPHAAVHYPRAIELRPTLSAPWRRGTPPSCWP